jgi:single-strand DNA-binding protein
METSRNKVAISGYIFKLTPRTTRTGKAVVSLTLELREGQQARQFISVTAWQGLGERAIAMGTGAKAYVTGKLRTSSWTNQAGQKQFKTEVVAEQLESIPHLHSLPDAEAVSKRPISDEDIPF